MLPRSTRHWLAACLVVLTACPSACPTDAEELCAELGFTVDQGDGQIGLENTPALGAPGVLVVCPDGTPLTAEEILFLLSTGLGSIAAPAADGSSTTTAEVRVRTDPQGRARLQNWILGRGLNEIRASLVDPNRRANPVVITGTGAPGDELTVQPTVTTPTPQVQIGSAVTPAPAVNAFYQNRGVSGVAFQFQASDPGDQVTGANATTGANGIAQVGGWTVGNRAGIHGLTATSTNPEVTAPAVNFQVEVMPGAAAALVKVAGDGQTAATGATVPVAPQVRVTDQHQNPVPNVAIQFQAGPSGGNVAGGNKSTDAAGLAAPDQWTLGNQAGQYSLIATVQDGGTVTGNPATFAATAVQLAGPPDSIYVVAGDSQQGVVGTALPVKPKVRVVDAQKRPVPGVQVRFQPGATGGTIAGGAKTTDPNGEAEADGWTLGTTAGITYILASGPNGLKGSPAVIQAMGLPGTPSTLTKVAGDGQTAIGGTAVPVRPMVKVADQYGNGVAGVTLTFTTGTPGSAVSGGTQVTDPQGRAQVGGWTLSATPGGNQLTATVTQPAGVTITPASVTFAATGVHPDVAPGSRYRQP